MIIPETYPLNLPSVTANEWQEDFSGLFVGADPTRLGYVQGTSGTTGQIVQDSSNGLVGIKGNGNGLTVIPFLHSDIEGEFWLTQPASDPSNNAGICFRTNPSGNGGYFVWAANGNAIYKLTGATSYTTLSSLVAGGSRHFTFSAKGNTITFSDDFGKILTVTDNTTLNGTHIGFYFNAGTICKVRVRRLG